MPETLLRHIWLLYLQVDTYPHAPGVTEIIPSFFPERNVAAMLDPKHPLAELLRRDDRYLFEAYVFVFDALRYGQENMGLGVTSASPDLDALLDDSDDDLFDAVSDQEDEEAERHVTGQELCHAIRRYAIDQYGFLSRSVLKHWGVTTTGDFGDIVFNLIDIGQMRKTDQDRREDFDDVFDFVEGFDIGSVFAPKQCQVETDDEE